MRAATVLTQVKLTEEIKAENACLAMDVECPEKISSIIAVAEDTVVLRSRKAVAVTEDTLELLNAAAVALTEDMVDLSRDAAELIEVFGR